MHGQVRSEKNMYIYSMQYNINVCILIVYALSCVYNVYVGVIPHISNSSTSLNHWICFERFFLKILQRAPFPLPLGEQEAQVAFADLLVAGQSYLGIFILLTNHGCEY